MTAKDAINKIMGFFEIQEPYADWAGIIYRQVDTKTALRWLGLISWLMNLWKEHGIKVSVQDVDSATILSPKEMDNFKICFARLASKIEE